MAGAEASVAYSLRSSHEAKYFGVITSRPEDHSLLESLIQKPCHLPDGELHKVLVSRLVLRPTIFEELSGDLMPSVEFDLGVALARLASAKDVGLEQVDEMWVTVGDPESYLQAQMAMASMRSFR